MLLKVFDPKVDMSELGREGDRTVGRFEWLGDARKAGSAASGGDRTLSSPRNATTPRYRSGRRKKLVTDVTGVGIVGWLLATGICARNLRSLFPVPRYLEASEPLADFAE